MKKLIRLLAVLLCLAALAMPVFADVILPPSDIVQPEPTVDDQAKKETKATDAAVKDTEAASDAAGKTENAPEKPDQTVLYVVIGAVVIAAAIALFFLLRKKN